MPLLASHASSMPRSGIRRIMDLAWASADPVIGLHVGEPSFSTPEHVRDAAADALARGETKYVPNPGIPALREAIADKVTTRNGFPALPEQVVVTAGGMQAISLALTAILTTGDEVLVPDPGWPNFDMAVRLLQGTPVRYPLTPERDFLPDVERLEDLVTDRTRAIVVNSPSNPLGTVFTEAIAEQLVRFADRHDLWVLSDECYDAFTFEAPHVSPARWDEQDRVLSLFSFSKTYAMTGMRVGYLVAPESVAPATAKMQEAILACVNAPAQRAALAALQGPQDSVEHMRATYRERRDRAVELLEGEGTRYLRPRGSFYLWLDVHDHTDGDVANWALDLLRRRHVAVAPGTAFGPAGEGWIRTSLATDTDQLLEGLARITKP